MSDFEHIKPILKRALDELGILGKLEEIQANILHNGRPFMSIEEAAKYTQIPKASLYTYCSRGSIEFYKRGRRTFFKKAELDQWILENKVKSDKEISGEASTYMVREKY